ncbi:MAG: hypothetical protein JZU67_05690, partial [Burkholderiaceae bacterium]|nr:hypothetical protein [Burkholderiaceae bacterium]
AKWHGGTRKVVGTNPEITPRAKEWLHILTGFPWLKRGFQQSELLTVAVFEISDKRSKEQDS